MQKIRRRRNIYAATLTACVLLIPCFAATHMRETAVAFGIAGAIALILFTLQSRTVYAARLICDNSILTVPTAVLSALGHSEEKAVSETVVSTFGALVGGKVYRWGCDGLAGSRLQSIEIDRERISLIFGNRMQTLNLRLLHGLNSMENVSQVKQRLFRETGVRAQVSGW